VSVKHTPHIRLRVALPHTGKIGTRGTSDSPNGGVAARRPLFLGGVTSGGCGVCGHHAGGSRACVCVPTRVGGVGCGCMLNRSTPPTGWCGSLMGGVGFHLALWGVLKK
jgi:hypothetical protein